MHDEVACAYGLRGPDVFARRHAMRKVVEVRLLRYGRCGPDRWTSI